MAVSFHPAFPLATAPPLPHHLDATADPEVADALLGFLCDPIDPAMDAGIDGFLDLSPVDPDDGADVDDDLQPCAKRPRAGCGGDDDGHAWLDFEGVDGQPWRPEFPTEFVLPLPPPPPAPQMPHAGFVRGADARRAEGNGRGGQTAPSAAARERRRRISEKTAELSRLVPGGHRLNTAEMLQEAGRHVKLLQAQVGVLALMRTLEEKIVPPVARERMHALLTCGGVQERLAAEAKCLVPRMLVEAMAEDKAVRSNAPLIRDLTRFGESLPEQ
ncbi:hypothetical protein VPH35_079895 [Triticum aestivum]|uniref:uncharacterized protein n=1 Tax=Triticum aestivum TaxID=4565 RepID=UPI00098B7B8D|nr:uncharacterized protein LOC109750357 [Aegilops tauschii subsp. strangulata]XP_044378330.1 uncharacterized protein LOC123100462 [Triticum aestivum]